MWQPGYGSGETDNSRERQWLRATPRPYTGDRGQARRRTEEAEERADDLDLVA